ncbi:MAG: PrsW family intramembrane metalloprotease [Candidatus Omnitrophica bacterium]|nr:PrsW family intramembrane metalloprotease [Candidatus Omnitrophota bacterium]
MVLVLAVALAPALALILYFYSRDRYEKEPLRALARSYGLGILIAFPAVVLERFLSVLPGLVPLVFLRPAVEAFVVVALVEEGLKYSAFSAYVFRHPDFDEPYDGILYAVMISLGFASLENVGYVLSAYTRFGMPGLAQIGLLRAFTAVPAHAFFGVLMGYYLGLARFVNDSRRAKTLRIRGLIMAVVAHGLYNWFLFANTSQGVLFMLLLLLLCYRFSLRAIRIHNDNSPHRSS